MLNSVGNSVDISPSSHVYMYIVSFDAVAIKGTKFLVGNDFAYEIYKLYASSIQYIHPTLTNTHAYDPISGQAETDLDDVDPDRPNAAAAPRAAPDLTIKLPTQPQSVDAKVLHTSYFPDAFISRAWFPSCRLFLRYIHLCMFFLRLFHAPFPARHIQTKRLSRLLFRPNTLYSGSRAG